MIYQLLTEENFHSHSLDGFIRRQEVAECWRKRGGQGKQELLFHTQNPFG